MKANFSLVNRAALTFLTH